MIWETIVNTAKLRIQTTGIYIFIICIYIVIFFCIRCIHNYLKNKKNTIEKKLTESYDNIQYSIQVTRYKTKKQGLPSLRPILQKNKSYKSRREEQDAALQHYLQEEGKGNLYQKIKRLMNREKNIEKGSNITKLILAIMSGGIYNSRRKN